MRRVLFGIHRWVGLVAGIYVLIVSITGAALVFRIDLQRASHPHLFTASAGPLADPVTIMESVARAFPDHRLSGVDAPTTTRPTYLAYVTSAATFKTVLVDPVSARVLGELPERTAVRTLQDLHYDLLSGPTGRVVNGIGAFAIMVLATTGVLEWWRGSQKWKRKRLWRELHRAIGIWSVAFISMWALTGAYFAFPATFRVVIGAVSPLSVTRAPQSDCRLPIADCSKAAWRNAIDSAQSRRPGAHVARVVLPYGDRGSWLVMFADSQPTPAYTELDSIYVDQFSGAVIDVNQQAVSAGDRLTRAVAPLHVGAFGGAPIRIAWFIFGLAPAVLAVTGAVVWMRR